MANLLWRQTGWWRCHVSELTFWAELFILCIVLMLSLVALVVSVLGVPRFLRAPSARKQRKRFAYTLSANTSDS